MKRSDMLYEIGLTIANCDMELSCEEIAESVLTAIEKAGMLPPTIRYDAVNEFVNIKETDLLSDNDASFAWEDE